MKTLPNQTASESAVDKRNFTANPPIVRGQCAQVLHLLRTLQPVPSFVLTADYAVPEAAARIHDLRRKGFNIRTEILPTFEFRGVVRRNVGRYWLDSPEWSSPDPLDERGR